MASWTESPSSGGSSTLDVVSSGSSAASAATAGVETRWGLAADPSRPQRVGRYTTRPRHWAHVHLALARQAQQARQEQKAAHKDLVTISVAGCAPLVASKPLLRIHSPFFCRHFAGHPDAVHVAFDEAGLVTSAGLRAAVDFVEMGWVDVEPSQLYAVFKAAEVLEMGQMKASLEAHLVRLARLATRPDSPAPALPLYALWLATRFVAGDAARAELMGLVGSRLASLGGRPAFAALTRPLLVAVLEKADLTTAPELAAVLGWTAGVGLSMEESERFVFRHCRFSADMTAEERAACVALSTAAGISLWWIDAQVARAAELHRMSPPPTPMMIPPTVDAVDSLIFSCPYPASLVFSSSATLASSSKN